MELLNITLKRKKSPEFYVQLSQNKEPARSYVITTTNDKQDQFGNLHPDQVHAYRLGALQSIAKKINHMIHFEKVSIKQIEGTELIMDELKAVWMEHLDEVGTNLSKECIVRLYPKDISHYFEKVATKKKRW